MSSAASVPIGSTLINVGNTTLGQFTGIQVGDGLVATPQGPVIRIDAMPVSNTPSNNPALTQPQWFINAITGNDSWTGAQATHTTGKNGPIKTHAELQRRIGLGFPLVKGAPAFGTTVTTINILTDLPQNDPINAFFTTQTPDNDTNNIVFYLGKATTVASGTITAVTPQNRALNQAMEIKASIPLAPWTGSQFGPSAFRIRITGGTPANIGQCAWLAHDLGGGISRISTPNDPALLDPSTRSPTPGIMTAGDSFVIERMPQVTTGAIEVWGVGNIAGNIPSGLLNGSGMCFSNLSFQNGITGVISGNSLPIFKGCDLNGFSSLGADSGNRSYYVNCKNNGFIVAGNGAFMYGGLFDGSGNVNIFPIAIIHASIYFDFDFMMQDTFGLVVNGFCGFASLAIFDSGGFGALDIGFESQAMLTLEDIQGSGQRALWGKNNPAPALFIESGNTGFKYPFANVANLTMQGDFALSGSAVARAWDDTAAAYVVPTIPCTFANLAVAVPAGFGGDAHFPKTNTHLVSY